MKNIYVITHTESIHHVRKLGGGWFDIPLTAQGRGQTKQIANAESRGQVGARIKNKLEEIIKVPSSNVVIVTHGFALSFVIMA